MIYRDFYEYVAEGKEPETTGRRNLETIGFVEAVQRSTELARPVDISDLGVIGALGLVIAACAAIQTDRGPVVRLGPPPYGPPAKAGGRGPAGRSRVWRRH